MNWLIRKVSLKDSELILNWRNNPEVYRYLFNPEPIALNVHERWLAKIICDESILFYIAEKNNIPVGTIRFDFNQDKTSAEVGIYLAPDFHGKGLGTVMLEKGEIEARNTYKTLKSVIAKVLVENIASEKMFLKAGYKKHFIQLEKKWEKNE